MNRAGNIDKERLLFLDNLRTLMVVFVLVFHAGASYGTAVSFWPFHDKNPSRFVDMLMFLADTFMMSILFFIAGYFALPSAHKKSAWDFIKGKFKRIGLPWLVATILVLPVLDYFHYSLQITTSGNAVRTYGAHWLLSIKKFSAFHIGWIDMNSYLNMTQQFYQRYLWFLSLLLVFFIIFRGIYGWAKWWEGKKQLTMSN
ncbi:acyltransferase family protein, partial [bacterium]|nr:acyltransferase family protein [bacterium]